MDELLAEFSNIGILLKDSPNLSGKVIRCPTNTNPKSKNGWYIGWTKLINGQDVICCSIGDWSQSNEAITTYKSWQEDNNLSEADLALVRKQQSEASKLIEKARKNEQKKAAENSQKIGY